MIRLRSRDEVLRWLREPDPVRREALGRAADAVRRARVGDAVHLRGLVEVGNACVRQCAYCGIRAGNGALARYRMEADEVLACARRAASLGCGTVVLQAGEDPGLTRDGVADVVRRIRSDTALAVTLSLGERDDGDLRAWRAAGADRYLLRFETGDAALYARIHPPRPGGDADRFGLLRRLRELDYEAGSGIMVGIPGQTWDSLADDLWRFREMDLDMIGIGPFVPHPATPLGCGEVPGAGPDQVPADEETTLRCLALARLLCPDANLPATTALGTVNPVSGRARGLRHGANVVMPDLTPERYRVLYDIYPAREPLGPVTDGDLGGLRATLAALGRTVAVGPGSRRGRAGRDGAARPATRFP